MVRVSDRREDTHAPRRDEKPVLPATPERDRDEAWGDEPSRREEEWYRRERPPHHE